MAPAARSRSTACAATFVVTGSVARSAGGSKASGTSADVSAANFSSSTAVGTATPCQRCGATPRLITPHSRPLESTSGPPSDPGLTAAVVSMAGPA